MKKRIILLATTLSAIALAGGVGVGVATADPAASPTPSTTSSPSGAPSASTGKPNQDTTKKGRDLTRRALHGEVTFGAKKPRVVDFQRGTVSAVSANSVTVRSLDGFVATYEVSPTTKVRVAKKQATIKDVATGDRVRVIAAKDGQTLTATRVIDREQ